MKRKLKRWMAKWSDGLLIVVWAYWLIQVPMYPEGIAARIIGLVGAVPMAWITKSLVLLGEEYESL